MRVDSSSNESREMLIKMNWFEWFWDDAQGLWCGLCVCLFFKWKGIFIFIYYIEMRSFIGEKGSEKWQENKGKPRGGGAVGWDTSVDGFQRSRSDITSNRWIYRFFPPESVHSSPESEALRWSSKPKRIQLIDNFSLALYLTLSICLSLGRSIEQINA